MKLGKIFSLLSLSLLLAACGPTSNPTSTPTVDPSSNPTSDPTVEPTIDPTVVPTIEPTIDPTVDPTTSEPTSSEPEVKVAKQDYFTTTFGYVGDDTNTYFESFQGGGTAEPITDDGYIRIYQANKNGGAVIGGCITLSVELGYIVGVKIGTAMDTTINYTLEDEVDFEIENKDLLAEEVFEVSGLNNSEITFHCLGMDKYHRLYVNYLEIQYVWDGYGDVPTTKPSTPSTPDVPVQGDWKSEDITLMKQHLAGYVLPYYDFEPYTLYWDDEYSCISVIGVSKTNNSIYEYAELLEKEGFEQYANIENDGFFDYEQYINDSAILQIQVYEDEESNLYIDAYLIEMLTSWPEAQVNEFCKNNSITEEVPAYNGANLYEINRSYESIGILIIYCYTDVDDPVGDYTKTLEAAGVTILYSEEYGTFYGPSALGTYQIEFFYDDEYGSLDIYIYNNN